MLIDGLKSLKAFPPVGKCHRLGRGFVAGRCWAWIHLCGANRWCQPAFAVRRAVVDCRAGLPDALDVCAAPTPLSVPGHVPVWLVRRCSPDLADQRHGSGNHHCAGLAQAGTRLVSDQHRSFLDLSAVEGRDSRPELRECRGRSCCSISSAGDPCWPASGWARLRGAWLRSGRAWVSWGSSGWQASAIYLYEAVSCMTDPPMQWGYPRTVEGYFHALSRRPI